MIDGVIFDCDGVLVDSEYLAIEVEREYLGELGLNYSLDDFRHRFLGLHDDEFRAALDADSVARRGGPLPDGFLDEVHRRRKNAVRSRMREVPGACAAIAALKHQKGVASSSHAPFLQMKLERANLWSHFAPHVYSADLVKRGKPAPDVFLYAAQQMKIEPARTISVNGIRSAVAAGMRAWGFVGGTHCDESDGGRLAAAGAERVVASFAELGTLLS